MLAFIEEGDNFGFFCMMVLLVLFIMFIGFCVSIYQWLFPKEEQNEGDRKIAGLVIISIITGCIFGADTGWFIFIVGLLYIWLIKGEGRRQKE